MEKKFYRDLDLKHLREVCNIDFAHYTFLKNQCSCCYGPKDLPKRYWKNGIIPENNNYTYILFKNAYNGSGTVTKNDPISDNTYIMWDMDDERLIMVIDELQRQLGNCYKVIKPENEDTCILIKTKKEEKDDL